MTQELQRREAMNPATGERFDLTKPDADLILALAEARAMRQAVDNFIQAVGRELTARMDQGASWTMRGGGFKASGTSPEPPEKYDGDRLFKALVNLVDAETITEDAAKQALTVEQSFKVKVGGVHALMKISPEVRAALEECRVEQDREQYARSRPAPAVSADRP